MYVISSYVFVFLILGVTVFFTYKKAPHEN